METLDIKILLVDHHELVRTGIHRLLEDQPGICVVGEADSGEKAVELARSTNPDVVLMDVQVSDLGALEVTRRMIRFNSDIRIVIVIDEVDAPFPTHLLEAGAAGCLTKVCSFGEIVNAIKVVHKRERYISIDLAQQRTLSTLSGSEQSPFDCLSQREMQVLLMVAQGKKIHEISDQLCLTSKTIYTYRYRLFDKLGVENDVELVRFAMRHGVVALSNGRQASLAG